MEHMLFQGESLLGFVLFVNFHLCQWLQQGRLSSSSQVHMVNLSLTSELQFHILDSY